MFDVSVPAHFQKLPIIAIARKNGGVFIDGDWIESKDISDSGIRYLTTGNVGLGEFRYQGSGYITEGTFSKLRCTEVLPGDILVSRLNVPIGRACLVPDLGERMVTSVDNVIIRPCAEFNRKFLVYLFSTKHHLEMMTNLARGTTMLRISRSALGRFRVQVPPQKEQIEIANFLDNEIGLIDSLTEKKNRFIALLKEKRVAVITHAVTKGIDPDAPTKDSGVDWLGRVPAHWEVVPPTALFTESKERAREGDQMLSATQKYGVIPLAEYEALEQRQVTMAMVNLNMRKHVEVGDFVISMRSMDGGLERARAVGSVRSSYSVLKPGPEVEGRFYGALMKSSLYIQALRLTSNFIRDGQDLNFGHVRKVKLPKPDLREQAAIADYIEAETARIDGMITLTERSIDLLREKRTALITAAVTGKIDVRAAA
jgi:type I restriction enzyme, S subunit